jgi:alkylated DNA nucleotide flippase Atl1
MPGDPRGPGGPSAFAGRVLDVVDEIPPARVMSYGDIAEYLGEGGPRQVGRAMALWGGGVPWWRVIHADGSPPPGHERAALSRYRAEGTPLRSAPARRRLPAPGDPPGRPRRAVRDGPVRVDMALARWPGPGRLASPGPPAGHP